MKFALVPTFLAAALLLPSELAAQDGRPTIVVQGDRAERESTTRSVRAISRPVDGALPRFEKPVCPGAVGLPPRLAAGVIERMRKVIAEAEVELAPSGCGANLTVIVAEDGAQLIDRLAQKSPSLFGELTAQDIARLERDAGPARSWHSTERKRADGAPVVRNSGGGSDTYMVQGARMSRLGSPVRMDVALGFVVIDTSAIDGLEVRQIADFAVMRGLASTRDTASGSAIPYDSILDLFTATNPVDRLTDFDRNYLRALYSGGNGFTYDQKTRQIASQVGRSDQDGR